jgi:hypothetical protein
MVQALLELVVAPALVGAATLAARRWGERVGGVVSAFPAIVGPVLLIAALEHGAAFAARAASGTLLGLVALSGFALAYGRVARHAGWPVALTAGWFAAAVLGVTVGALAPGPLTGLAAATVSLAAAHRTLRAPALAAPVHAATAPSAPGIAAPANRATTPRPPAIAPPANAAAVPRPPAWDLPVRMALTALLVVSLTAAASRLGPIVGGVLAALPVLASVLAAFTHAQCGGAPAADLLRGMLRGMAGFVAFCALVALLAEPAGIAVAFAISTLAALAVQAATVVGAAATRPAPATATAATAP